MRAVFSGVLAVLVALGASASAAPTERPYTWQSYGVGAPRTARVAYELGVGTRDSRFFGADGVEQGVRLRYQPWRGVGVEAFGGLLLHSDHAARPAAGAEVVGRALWQEDAGVDLDLAGGYGFDYRERQVLRARAALGRTFGRLDLRLGSAVEVPVSGEGDAADLSLTFGASYRVTPWWRQGIEVGGEDLEGFWEEEEAEGGAKLLLGPTAYFTLGGGVELRMNVAAVYAPPTAGAPAGAATETWGLLGRASLAYTFGE
ncbi:MAG: hypothetical protein EP329_24925 [Deltaproteobacteria bacterium]|nr:MAG: hypothetical protein EP329_24925 [Deltaproteobacteria bacterium]